MAVCSVAAMYVQLTLTLDVQFRGISAIDLFHFDAALEDGVLSLEGFVLGLKGLHFGLEGLKASLPRAGNVGGVRGNHGCHGSDTKGRLICRYGDGRANRAKVRICLTCPGKGGEKKYSRRELPHVVSDV